MSFVQLLELKVSAMPSGKKGHDLIGKKIGRLTVVERIPVTTHYGQKMIKWKCICECGNVITPCTSSLLRKKYPTISCGCYRRENTTKRNLKHGYSGTSEYNIWCSMKERCYTPKSIDFPNYGGRGIIVCDRWKHCFENFINDMGMKKEGMSLDRINNNGNYEPSNCRWATASQQAYNRRTKNKKG